LPGRDQPVSNRLLANPTIPDASSIPDSPLSGCPQQAWKAHHGTAYWRLKADPEDHYGKPFSLAAGFNHHAPGIASDDPDFRPAPYTARTSFRREPLPAATARVR